LIRTVHYRCCMSKCNVEICQLTRFTIACLSVSFSSQNFSLCVWGLKINITFELHLRIFYKILYITLEIRYYLLIKCKIFLNKKCSLIYMYLTLRFTSLGIMRAQLKRSSTIRPRKICPRTIHSNWSPKVRLG